MGALEVLLGKLWLSGERAAAELDARQSPIVYAQPVGTRVFRWVDCGDVQLLLIGHELVGARCRVDGGGYGETHRPRPRSAPDTGHKSILAIPELLCPARQGGVFTRFRPPAPQMTTPPSRTGSRLAVPRTHSKTCHPHCSRLKVAHYHTQVNYRR